MYANIRIDHSFRLLLAIGLAILAGLFPPAVLHAGHKFRRAITALTWFGALAALVIAVSTFPLNDDEVFYLAQAWAALTTDDGQLPMRGLIAYPFLLPPLSPAMTVMAARIGAVLIALACGLGVASMARRLRCDSLTSALAAPMTILWLTTEAEHATFRPEYFATGFFVVGVWALIASPINWALRTSVVVSFASLTLMASTSYRLGLLMPTALAALCVDTRVASRVSAMRWAIWGMLMGSLPSIVYLIFLGSPTVLFKSHWTMLVANRTTVLPPFSIGFVVPLAILGCAAIGAVRLWTDRKVVPGAAVLSVLWLGATASALLNPLKFDYTLGPWLCMSAATSAYGLAQLSPVAPSSHYPRAYSFVAALLCLPSLFGQARGPVHSPGFIRTAVGGLSSQLRLLNWLDTTAAGRMILCVSPCHPIRAINGWRQYNAHAYCYFSRRLGKSGDPDLEQTLLSGNPAIIQWDAWPYVSTVSNILDFVVARGFVPTQRRAAIEDHLRSTYLLVRWSDPLPPLFGGGHFLVRRGLSFAGPVEVISDWGIPARTSM